MAAMKASARHESWWRGLLLSWFLCTAMVSIGYAADAVCGGSPGLLSRSLIGSPAAALFMAVPFTGVRRWMRSRRDPSDAL
jgi:hypothetical protein